MGDGKHCPSCGKDIGVWPILSAGLPSRVRCPHCKSRLRYRKTARIIAFVLVGLYVLVVGAFVLASSLATPRRGLVWATVVTIGCVVVELVTTWVFRNRRELELDDRSQTKT